MLVFVT